ncbi:30S ribosomal protein S15 [Morus notabilis]|uniref:Small ribosomal subunit protein uS15c n=1 Tax=Morus notabilis TaxID=981085 RepID=W9RE90_9ROSA|nr:30S ribosomal protein S15 [Morus notabilis]
MKTEFVKVYSYEELGEKLKKLRPEGKGEGWFSMEELNQRLMNLREIEQKETESRIAGLPYRDLRESLAKLRLSSDEEKAGKASIERLDVLGQLGRTPSFMMQPPKEHLVERASALLSYKLTYFHPDNMSSAEKMKSELAKVRDEFKMSESDCGSARVQVAQLTTKIKHLSAVLHKKDKHSRKGLVAMVQKRKKLLKYLRRTDWESYCFVLDKLGLRDNPDYKN